MELPGREMAGGVVMQLEGAWTDAMKERAYEPRAYALPFGVLAILLIVSSYKTPASWTILPSTTVSTDRNFLMSSSRTLKAYATAIASCRMSPSAPAAASV